MCSISYHFSYHVTCLRLAYLWSPVVCSKLPFQAIHCPVNVYFDLDVSCIVACIVNSSLGLGIKYYYKYGDCSPS